MSLQKITQLFCLGGLVFVIFYACTSEVEPVLDDDDLTVRVHWVPGQLLTSKADMETGVAWTMNSLGAMLPPGSLRRGLIQHTDHEFSIRFGEMGFSREAQRAILRVLQEIRQSDEYRQNGHVQLGRLVMLVLNSSFHYYEITGASETLSAFRDLYQFNGVEVAVVQSTVSSTHRLLEVADASSYAQIAHIGSESGQRFEDGPFEPREFETLDAMPNGNLRFAIYGADGRLRPFADESLTLAGRPTKCMWCHESTIQPFFSTEPVSDTDSTLTMQEFLDIREQQTGWINSHRAQQVSDFDFTNRRDHQYMEWIYEDFMEPDAEYLAMEWGISLASVTSVLKDIESHFRAGRPGYYHRKDVDPLAPYAVLRVPEAARDRSDFEPNYFE